MRAGARVTKFGSPTLPCFVNPRPSNPPGVQPLHTKQALILWFSSFRTAAAVMAYDLSFSVGVTSRKHGAWPENDDRRREMNPQTTKTTLA